MDDSRIMRGRLKFMSTTEIFCLGSGKGMECLVVPRINGAVSDRGGVKSEVSVTEAEDNDPLESNMMDNGSTTPDG